MEVNSRVNYPLKCVLIEMSEDDDIIMSDPLHKFCTSWFTIQVVNSGIELFVTSWNNHPLPGMVGIPSTNTCSQNYKSDTPPLYFTATSSEIVASC